MFLLFRDVTDGLFSFFRQPFFSFKHTCKHLYLVQQIYSSHCGPQWFVQVAIWANVILAEHDQLLHYIRTSEI